MARISPPIVNSRASMATGNCNSRSVAEVIREHVVLETEGIDRMYLNVYQPKLQTEKGQAEQKRHDRQPKPQLPERIGGNYQEVRRDVGIQGAKTPASGPTSDAADNQAQCAEQNDQHRRNRGRVRPAQCEAHQTNH